MIQTIAKIAGTIICIISILTYALDINIVPMNTLFASYFLFNITLLVIQISLHGFSGFTKSKEWN
jgi:hypothetical protein